MEGHGCWVVVDNLVCEGCDIPRLEGAAEAHELVQDNPQTPDVAFVVILQALERSRNSMRWRQSAWRIIDNKERTHKAQLRAVVSRGADLCFSLGQGVFQGVCDTEISHFDLHVRGEEDIGSFDVSVEHLALMAMTDGQADLHKPGDDLILSEGEPFGFALLNSRIQITAGTVLHDNVHLLLAI